jgi:hypothetical protein
MTVPPIPVAHLRLVELKRIDLYEQLRNEGCVPIAEPRPISLRRALAISAVFIVVVYSLLTAALVLL